MEGYHGIMDQRLDSGMSGSEYLNSSNNAVTSETTTKTLFAETDSNAADVSDYRRLLWFGGLGNAGSGSASGPSQHFFGRA